MRKTNKVYRSFTFCCAIYTLPNGSHGTNTPTEIEPRFGVRFTHSLAGRTVPRVPKLNQALVDDFQTPFWTKRHRRYRNWITFWCTICTLLDETVPPPPKLNHTLVYDLHTPYWTNGDRCHRNWTSLWSKTYAIPIEPNDTEASEI